MSRAELESLLEAQGGPRYHGDQVFRWLYAKRRFDPSGFTDIPKAIRAALGRLARVDVPTIATRVTADDGTVKYGEPTRIESAGKLAYVIIPTVYTYKEHGSSMTEEGQMTFVLDHGSDGWKIRAWTWSGVKPHAPH